MPRNRQILKQVERKTVSTFRKNLRNAGNMAWNEGLNMAKYEWAGDTTKMLRMLRNSRTLKVKSGWSRNVGSGFIAEDITNLTLNPDKTITVTTQAFKLTQKTSEFNLRETEELIRWLETDAWKKAKPTPK